MYLKLKMINKAGLILYPIDINVAWGWIYNKDLTECVCYTDENISASDNITIITEQDYEQYKTDNSISVPQITEPLQEQINNLNLALAALMGGAK